MKLQDYIIELKKPSYFLPDLVSRLMLVIAIVVFGYGIYVSQVMNKYTIGLAVSIVGIVAFWMRAESKRKNSEIVYYRTALLMATLGWVILARAGGPVWIPVLYFVAVLIEKQVKFPQEIAFNEGGIVVNSFPRKEYKWTDLNNVILRDNILTVDFKNNKLIQKEIESAASVQDEQDFNAFCAGQLAGK